jgi:hypothetical protein
MREETHHAETDIHTNKWEAFNEIGRTSLRHRGVRRNYSTFASGKKCMFNKYNDT